MYNKLFTKILDSSIWLAPDPVRLVWITLIAAMDEDGNCMFACAANVAARARVTVEQAESALNEFEAPDSNSGDPDNEGRRIERIPGGWHLLNAHKYRAMVTKAIIREQTRQRTARYRQRDATVTQCDANERKRDAEVTPSEAVSKARSKSTSKEEEKKEKPERKRSGVAAQLVSVEIMVAEGVDHQHATDWLVARKAKGLPLTPTAWAETRSEASKAGLSVPEAIRTAAANGWGGFKAKWLQEPASGPPSGPPSGGMTFKERDAANAAEVYRQMTGGRNPVHPNQILREERNARKLEHD